MSDGNKFDVTTYAQQHQHNRLSLEEMGNVLLDAMQGTLICLDNHHVIIEVSKSIKHYFGFEQTDILGLSILLLVEDSERDPFAKFLSSTSQSYDICSVRMMMAISNEYRQVKVHRRRKFNHDNADVHSTTPRHNGLIGTILVLTLDNSSYIDLSLFDIHKQEFYTKMNLIGEIIFEDHRGALITGYLPHEILSQSIFTFVYREDRLVKLHALWKCVTTGSSKLQWRFIARDGSVVYLQTEYKLIANHQNQEMIVARNEVLNSIQRSQFEEAQKTCLHQCTLDIRGNSSSFKRMTSIDMDPSAIPAGECVMTVPSLNMCFSTNRLQSLNIIGSIFDISRSTRPLTIQDYISILIEHDKYLDNELIHMIHNLSSLSSRYKYLNNRTASQNDPSDGMANEKSPADSLDPLLKKKNDSDSIVRGLLSNSIQYNHEKSTGDSTSTLTQLLNENSGQHDLVRTSVPPQAKANSTPLTPEAFQQQHRDFFNKYRSAKAKLESQLHQAQTIELNNGGDIGTMMKRNTIVGKLYQLENIKNKHLARAMEFKRQNHQPMGTPSLPSNSNLEQNSLFSPSTLSPNSMGLMSMDNSPHPTNIQPSLYNPSVYYPNQPTNSPGYRSFDSNRSQSTSHESHTPTFEEFLTPPPSYLSMSNSSLSIHSHMNVSFQETTNNNNHNPSTMTSTNSFNHHNTMYPY